MQCLHQAQRLVKPRAEKACTPSEFGPPLTRSDNNRITETKGLRIRTKSEVRKALAHIPQTGTHTGTGTRRGVTGGF